MINTFRLKKAPTVRACQWNGENRREINDFLGTFGSVHNDLVQYTTTDLGRPSLGTVSVGQYLVEIGRGNFVTMTANELFGMYELED